MSGKMLNTMALLVLASLAHAQLQTKPSEPIKAARHVATLSSREAPSLVAVSGPGAHRNHSITAAPKAEAPASSSQWTSGAPVHNAGRRPSQPGMKKLTLFVGLATYGLILL